MYTFIAISKGSSCLFHQNGAHIDINISMRVNLFFALPSRHVRHHINHMQLRNKKFQKMSQNGHRKFFFRSMARVE